MEAITTTATSHYEHYSSSSSSDDVLRNDDDSLSYKLRKEQFVYGLEGTTPWELLLICSTTFTGIVLYYYYYYYYCCTTTRKNQQPQLQPPPQQQQSRSFNTIIHIQTMMCEVFVLVIPMILCQTIWIYPYGVIYIMTESFISIGIIVVANFKSRNDDNHATTTTTTTVEEAAVTDVQQQQQQQLIVLLCTSQETTMTIYRSGILLHTIISILAVDFHLYPRRYGKTEVYGYGLMDLGAASNIIMAALSSSRARSASSSTRSGVNTYTNINTSSISSDTIRTDDGREQQHQDKHDILKPQTTTRTRVVTARKQLRKMIPLLIMGTLRLITHKGIDYPEHNSEYGVHWNFFYTLALIIPMTSLLSYRYGVYGTNQKQQQPPSNWILPVFILIIYQYVLTYQNLQQFIVNAPRTCPTTVAKTTTTTSTAVSDMSDAICSIWYANREGIVGCISYAALYLLSEYIAFTYFWNTRHLVSSMSTNSSSKTTTTSNIQFVVWDATKQLWYVVVALLVTWQFLTSSSILHFTVSRRSTNTMFCIWVLFVNLFQLASIFTIVLLCSTTITTPNHHLPSIHPPLLVSSINRNGLYIFIIANLFTGLINLSIDTLSVSNTVAIGILLLYMSMVGTVSILMDSIRSHLGNRSLPSSRQGTKED